MMLAAALVRQPDFLILDEPTNHLDIAMTEWLEKYLQEFKGGLLAVSHDRAFLDNIATRILEMEGGHLTSFKGNYSKYLVQKELQTATLEAAYASQQDYIARTEAYIRRFKAGIKVRWRVDANLSWIVWSGWTRLCSMRNLPCACRLRRSLLNGC